MICVIDVINVMDNEQEFKNNKDPRKILVNLARKSPGIWFLSLFLMPIGVAIFAYNQLIYTGYVPQKQPEETPFIPVQSTISTFSDPSNPLPLWLIIASHLLLFYRFFCNFLPTAKCQRKHKK